MINDPRTVPNCTIWLDAADSSTLGKTVGTGIGDVDSGDRVGLWQDKVTGKQFVQNSDGNRPTYFANLSSLDFSNADRACELLYAGLLVYNQQTTFVVVDYMSPNNAGFGHIYTQQENSGETFPEKRGYSPLLCSTQIDIWNRLFFGSWTNISGTPSNVANTQFPNSSLKSIFPGYTVLCSRHTGTQLLNFHNGRPNGIVNTILNQNRTPGTLNVEITKLGNTNSSLRFKGKICEVIVYNRALNFQECTHIHNYLARKWNVVADIPRSVYPLQSGNWSTINWSISAEPSPWNTIKEFDEIYTHSGFNVNIDAPVKVACIENRDLFSGNNNTNFGTFTLMNGVSLSADLVSGSINPITNAQSPRLITLASGASSEIVGSFYFEVGGTNDSNAVNSNFPVIVSGSGTSQLTIKGDVTGHLRYYVSNPARYKAIEWSSSAPLVIYGNVIACYPYLRGFIENTSSGNIFVYGNVYGSFVANEPYYNIGSTQQTRGAIRNMSSSTGNVFVSGDVFAGTSTLSYGILNESSVGNVYVHGNVRNAMKGVSNQTAGIRSNSSTTTIFVTGNVTGAENSINDNNNYGIWSQGSKIRLKGNVYGGGGGKNNPGIFTTNGDVIIEGDLFSNISSAVWSTSLTPLSVITNQKDIMNGVYKLEPVPVITSPAYRYFPLTSAALQRTNFTQENGATLFYYTTAFSFSLPTSSNTIKGFSNNDGSLIGNMTVPAPSAVALFVPIGNPTTITNLLSGEFYKILTTDGLRSFQTVGAKNNLTGTIFIAQSAAPFGNGKAILLGKATLDTSFFWNKPLVELSAVDTVGPRMKLLTTTTETSSTINFMTTLSS